MKLAIAGEQRFTCQQCGMCCRGVGVVVTPDEAARYRATGAARWHRDAGDAAFDPFEPVAHGHFRIRRRADGACGFLSDENRCRIHEQLGAAAKPLACRVFPFRFHQAEGRPLVTASASCPTIVRNEGATLASQAREIGALRAEWARAFPEKGGGLFFASGQAIDGGTLSTIKGVLLRMLDPPGGDTPGALARDVERMARWLEDLSRHRVSRLAPEAFAEYAALTGRHAAETAAGPEPSAPSAVTRLLSRGFLFTVVAVRDREASPDGMGLHLRRVRQLAHLHGLAPATEALDRRALARTRLADDFDALRILRHALRSAVDALGTGRRPLLDEMAVQAATLAAGLALAAMAARREGRDVVEARALVAGITAASHLGYADSGAMAAVLPSLAGGVDALRLVGAWLARAEG